MNKVIKYIRKMIGIIDNPKPKDFRPRRLRAYKLVDNNDVVISTTFASNDEIALTNFRRWLENKEYKVIVTIKKLD